MPEAAQTGNLSASAADEGRRLIDAANGLEPVLRQRALEAEQARRVSDATIADFRRSQITRAIQPPRYGGIATDFGVAARITEALARGCPSSAWVYANFILLQWHIGLFPVDAQEEIWGPDTDHLIAAGYMPVGVAGEVEGGYTLNGTWNYVSAIDNADWCLLGGRVVPKLGEPVQGFFVLPRTDYTIDDNWHVVGLAGTGSKNVIAEDAFVPAHRFLSIEACNSGSAPGLSVNDHPIFRAPLFAIFNYFLSGVALGAAGGAIEDFIASITERKTVGGVTGKRTPISEFATVQLALAEAEAKVDAARTLIQRDCDLVVSTLATGQDLSLDQRINNRRSIGFGVRLAKEAVDELFYVTGAGGLFSSNLVQRHWRDVHAVAHHLSLHWNQVGALVGGYRLGIEPAGMY